MSLRPFVAMATSKDCAGQSRGADAQPRKATFSDGFAVAQDGCRLSYHLSGNPEAEDKVCVPPSLFDAPFRYAWSGHQRACLALRVVCVARAHADLLFSLLCLCRQNVALSACASRSAHRAHLSQRQTWLRNVAPGPVGDELCMLQKLNLN